MSVASYDDLRQHIGHELECVEYGHPTDERAASVVIECLTCGEVLIDFDKEVSAPYSAFHNTPAYAEVPEETSERGEFTRAEG